MTDVEQTLGDMFGFRRPWRMAAPERLAVIAILEKLRPRCAIEVGTAEGGCLEAISRFSQSVWSIDVNPEVGAGLCQHFKNVEFLTGYPQKVLPEMIERANVERLDIGFILIDGDHSREGVGSDIGAVLKYVPVSSTVVLMHDSFNPECRRGIAEAPWQQSLHVHAVDLDLVPGVYWNPPVHGSSLWGGLGIAILRNHKRTQCLQMSAAYAPLFEQCRSACGDRV